MADSADSKAVKVPILNNEKGVHLWLIRFMAFAVVANIVDSVQTKPHKDLPEWEDTVLVSPADDDKIAAKKENLVFGIGLD